MFTGPMLASESPSPLPPPGSMKTDFITNVNWTEESEAYRDSTVGQVRRYIEQYGEDNIAGDPQKIAAVIYHLTQLPAPPLRSST